MDVLRKKEKLGDKIPQKKTNEKNKKLGDKIPTKKTTEENKKSGDRILTDDGQNATDHQEGEQQESSPKRKYSSESNEPEKMMKSGEQEAFVFKEGGRVYRCVAEPEGYQCCMCPNVFSQLGRHISSSKCGESLDVKRFKAELKKYLKVKNYAKNSTKRVQYREKKLAENPEEYRQKDAQRKKKERNEQIAANPEMCRQKEAGKKRQSRNKILLENPVVYKQNEVRNKQKSV